MPPARKPRPLLLFAVIILTAADVFWSVTRSATSVSASALVATSTGWFAVLLVPALITLPYLARYAVSGPVGIRVLHYWTGYSVGALGLVHTLATMYTPAIRHTNGTGLRLATLALLLLLIQALLGIGLQQVRPPRRDRLRQLHYWLMYATTAAIVSHVALNH